MNPFEFNGDWEYQVQLPAFSGLQSRGGAYTSVDADIPVLGLVRLVIEDDLTDNPDPYQEQMEAIKYLLDYQQEVHQSIIKKLLEELPAILENYGLSERSEYAVLNESNVRNLFGIGQVDVMIEAKDGISYLDFSGGCNWDEEHGIHFLVHKDRIVDFGAIDGNAQWNARSDNGIQAEHEANRKVIHAIPGKYTPHPKYNKLKPSQLAANLEFESKLIAGNHNELFQQLLEMGEIDVNGKSTYNHRSWLELACSSSNTELVSYLLKKGAHIGNALHHAYASNPEAFDLILRFGGSINAQDGSGNTILNGKVQQLATLFDSKAQYTRYNWNGIDALNRTIEQEMIAICELEMKGADPGIKNQYGFNVFSMSRNLPEEVKKEMDEFLVRVFGRMR